MNGKDYVVKARDLVSGVISQIKAQGRLEGDARLDRAVKACEDLERLQSKATLRTKNGTNRAFPVMDFAQKLGEAWDECQSGGNMNEFVARLDEFVDAVTLLEAVLQERTVIMT